MSGKLKNLFVLTTLVAAASYYFLYYSCDEVAALSFVLLLVLLTSATFGKLVRVKIDLVTRRRVRKKFFKVRNLKE